MCGGILLNVAQLSLFDLRNTLAIVCDQVDADVVLKAAGSSKQLSRTAGLHHSGV